jgi:hypothetical protein
MMETPTAREGKVSVLTRARSYIPKKRNKPERLTKACRILTHLGRRNGEKDENAEGHLVMTQGRKRGRERVR